MRIGSQRGIYSKKPTQQISGSGVFTPATGVLAAVHGNTLSSSPVTGIGTGTLLDISLTGSFSAAPSGIGPKPVAAAPLAYYPMETDFNPSPLTRSGGGTALSAYNTPTYGGIQITSSPPTGLGSVAGCAVMQPNNQAAPYKNDQPFANVNIPNSTTNNWYVYLKKYETAYADNLKRWRFWSSLGISYNDVYTHDIGQFVDVGGGVIFNSVQTGPSLGFGGLYTTYYDPGINQWNSYEIELASGTSGNFDGLFNVWTNGHTPVRSGVPVNGSAWNLVYSGNASPEPLNAIVSFGQNTYNAPGTTTPWVSGQTSVASSYYTQGTNPRNGQPYIFYCTTGGTSGSTGPIGCAANSAYEINLGGGNYTEPGSTVKWQWFSNDYFNPTGLSGAYWYYGMIYVDDSPCRTVSSTESTWNYTGQTTSVRELWIPTAWNSAGTLFTDSVRQGSFATSSGTHNVYKLGQATSGAPVSTAYLVGTITW